MSIPAAPTQVTHPWRAVVRTFIAAGVGVAVAWVARTLGVDLTTFTPAIVDSLTAAAWALGTGLVQWLLTRPRVEAWLRRYVSALAANPAPTIEALDEGYRQMAAERDKGRHEA